MMIESVIARTFLILGFYSHRTSKGSLPVSTQVPECLPDQINSCSLLRAASNLYYNVQVMLRDVQCSDAPHSKIEHKITRGLGNWVGKVARRCTQVSQFKDTLG